VDLVAKVLTNPLVLRIAWQVAPSTVICWMFWVAALRFSIQDTRALKDPWSQRLAVISIVGIALNFVVTMMNGGYMPVVGDMASGISVWTTATDAHHLLFLADQGDWWGFSIGDGFIFGGLFGRLAYWSGRQIVTGARTLVRQPA